MIKLLNQGIKEFIIRYKQDHTFQNAPKTKHRFPSNIFSRDTHHISISSSDDHLGEKLTVTKHSSLPLNIYTIYI